jgi:hypothetical protein
MLRLYHCCSTCVTSTASVLVYIEVIKVCQYASYAEDCVSNVQIISDWIACL